MFRRKEEGLFDTTTDQNQSQGVVESATVISPSAPQQSAPSYAAQPIQQPTQAAAMPRPPVAPSAPAQQPQAATASSFRPSAPAAPMTSDLSRNRMPEASKPAQSAAQASAASQVSADKIGKARRVLTVGNDILLKGEIATCDRLVIEGKVDATLNDVHTVEIAEHGSFKGSAHIEDAEISGLFEGDLVVRNRLVIYSTGKVRGKITYGEIEIQRGGELTGEIKTSSGQPTAAQRSVRQPKEDKAAA